MNKRPWMPLDIADYLADTGHLTTLEHGAYMLLIMEYWKQGGLPDDERKIAKITRLPPDEWEACRDTLADLFMPGWKHKRVEEELAKAAEIIEKRRSAATARHANSKSSAHAEQVQSTCSDTHVPPLTSDQPSSLRSDGERAAKRAARLPEGWTLPDGWGQDAIAAGLPAHLIDLEASKMLDWSRSSPKGVKLDWRATWRNWCRDAVAKLPQARGSPPTSNRPDVSGAIHQLRQSMGANNGKSGSGPGGDRQDAVRLPAPQRAGNG